MSAAIVCATGASLYPYQHMNKASGHLSTGQHVTTRGAWRVGVHAPVELTNPKGFVYGDLIDPPHTTEHKHEK